MTRTMTLASLGIALALFAPGGEAQEKQLDMIPVKYDALKQEVLKQRGKVLVIDFWAGW